jgi:hypothetical protein
MIEDVTKRFDLAIKTKFKDKLEIQNFLLKHDRKNLCINRLCEQIVRAENYNIKVSVKTYDSVIGDIAMLFAKAVLQKHEEEHYTSIQKQQILAKNNAIKDAQEILKDLEKDTINDKGLTEIERDEIKQAIQARKADEVQT